MVRRAALLAVAALALAVTLGLRRAPAVAHAVTAPPRAVAAASPPAPVVVPQSTLARRVESAAAPRADSRLQRAESALAIYLASAQYPPSCRPMRERPELAAPNHVASRTLPVGSRARVTLHQDRYYTAAGDVATLHIACSPAPCEVRGATAAPDVAAAITPRPVAFTRAEGGAVEARFAPDEAGFADFHGPIRITASLDVGGERGDATFAVEHTPSPPASFTGAVREERAGGSLDLLAGVDVARGGRYVITARVEDARGNRFAYLRFNDVLEPGRREVRLQLFGKVVLDEGAVVPFALHDLEGMRLDEGGHPDRETMRAALGLVFTTARWSPRDFSPEAWESEEKARRVAFLQRDVDRARR